MNLGISGERQPFPLVPKIGICGGSTCRVSTVADSKLTNVYGVVGQVLGLPIEP